MAKRSNNTTAYIKYFWLTVGGGLATLLLFILLVSIGVFGSLPGFEEIENPKSNLATQIISQDGVVLGKFFKENRTHAEFEDLSPHLVNALIATEDERFYSHSGLDVKALVRAVVFLGKAGGGSTITQQLAKMLFHDPPKNILERIIQKAKEWIIALRIERQYSKQEILAMYLNQFDFLYQAVGIESASYIYFSKAPKDLEIQEAALLVGMAKNPSHYNPVRFPERALQRRNTVLKQMLRNKFISAEEFEELKQRPLGLQFRKQSHNEGPASYLREHIRLFLTEWVKTHKKPDGGTYNIYTDGLKVYTSIDSRMQQYAEEAVTEHLSNYQRVFFARESHRKDFPFVKLTQTEIEDLLNRAMRRSERYKSLKSAGVSQDSIIKNFNTPVPMQIFSWNGEIDTLMTPMDSIRYYKSFYQTGFMAVEPQTGFVKAWVGGINFKHFKYDNVFQAKRQVGSTFKPFLYATAIKEKKYSPCFEVPDARICIEAGMYGLLQDWCPSNSDDKYEGMMTLKRALAESKNTVSTFLMKQIGPASVVQLCADLGITSEVPVAPSIALGTMDLSVYELIGAYTTFANKGTYTQPIVITRIEDKNGLVLAEFEPETREVLSEEVAYVMLDLLKAVTQFGTGARLRSRGGSYMDNVVTGFPWGFDNPIAGKTGTTQNNSDGWFVGMVPNLVAGAWVGCEDRSAHFRSTYFGQGATAAMPVWALFMKKCYSDPSLKVSKADFEPPQEPISIVTDCNRYKQLQEADDLPDWIK
ncbi:penicillin-binding protein 1A [Schleiferia thermophila]|jgi:penicillin-binding protein 1A|uniref:Penicillin-binding protein 1A n=1 Tax=Schleiferia thermophila TaxID=884107 RepID=A0A369A254_9FLAO|nr:PBP1A family penicillin-binding protein [Schleiferia thermophila]KFD39339.1 penicillin-binding protein 1A [Schleiferia thermophila str. Yellowstone]RCX03265.1 penicillin-binding protein 1A [Schleiferia thermophila]GCD80393.1 penicillin-binding protein 1A [Schleiferia thermophila]